MKVQTKLVTDDEPCMLNRNLKIFKSSGLRASVVSRDDDDYDYDDDDDYYYSLAV